jgi:hypothetical protein
MPLLRGFRMRPQGILRKPKSIRGLFGFKSSFQNCFWDLFSTSGLSETCKIINVWKLPSPFSRNTLMSCTSLLLEFKNIILEEKLSNKFTNDHENFSGVRVSIFLELLAWMS